MPLSAPAGTSRLRQGTRVTSRLPLLRSRPSSLPSRPPPVHDGTALG